MAASQGPAWIIIVTGPPCGGKSWLAARLKERLHLPVLAKDPIKERLFETLGWGSPEWSDALNTAANALMRDMVELLLATRCPFVIESNLRPDRDGEAYSALQQQWGFQVIQIHCSADPEELLERYRRRWRAGRRHPGHADDRAEPMVAEKIRAGLYAPLELAGPVIRIETDDNRYVDDEAIVDLVQTHIARIEEQNR